MTEPAIRTLYDEAAIASRTRAMAAQIAAADTRVLLAVAVLKGSFMFAADLLRALHGAGLSPQVEFVHLSSYGAGTESSGTVRVVRDIESGAPDIEAELSSLEFVPATESIDFKEQLKADRPKLKAKIVPPSQPY